MKPWGALWLLIAGLLGVAGLAAGDATDQAMLNYQHGFEASGAFSGTCDLLGVRFQPPEPTAIEFFAEHAHLTVYKSRVNHTYVLGPAPQAWAEYEGQEKEFHDLGTGRVMITVRPDSHLSLATEAILKKSGPITAEIEGSRWTASAAESVFPTAGEWGHYYYEDYGEPYVHYNPPNLRGAAFILKTDEPTMEVAGDGLAKMDQVVVKVGDFQYEMPAFQRTTWERWVGPTVYLRTVIETYAVLRLDGFSSVMPTQVAEPVCKSLSWGGSGVVTYRTSAGWAARGDERHEFNRQELTLNGTFTAQEQAFTVDDVGGRNLAQAQSQGSFNAVGIDFSAIEWTPAVAAEFPLQKVGLVALIIAAISSLVSQSTRLVAFFYTRVGTAKALDHPIRSAIHAAARDRPGLILRDLVVATGRPYAVIRHHAAILTHLGLVRSVRYGKALHLYPSDASALMARRELVLGRDEAVRYLRATLGPEGRSFRDAMREIQTKFGYSRMGAWKVLRRSEKVGLVRRDERAEGVWLCAAA